MFFDSEVQLNLQRDKRSNFVYKKKVIKKILLQMFFIRISSIDKQIMKLLLKIMQGGPEVYLTEKTKEQLIKYSQTILDVDRQQQLENELNLLESCSKSAQTDKPEIYLKIINFFILSKVQKNFIAKIEEELKEGVFFNYQERLDEEITIVEHKIDGEKKKRLQSQKKEIRSKKEETSHNLLKQIETQQNKLQKANQKLNEIITNNSKLRDKINQLRKEKNVMEDIYNKLKEELEIKRNNVNQTIKTASDAYQKRKSAEADLRNLKQKAEKQKQDFKKTCQQLNKNIHKDLKFKQFIKTKKMDQQVLNELENTIKRNEEIIRQKKQANQKIEDQYKISAKKEEEIKEAFERIKRETGISDKSIQKESQQLLQVFVSLYEKNMTMNQFVTELNKDIQKLEEEINKKKEEIQKYSIKGANTQFQSEEQKKNQEDRIAIEKKKKDILQSQYLKSIDVIKTIKGYIHDVFNTIGANQELMDKLKCQTVNQQNMIQFLGQLQRKSLQTITEYAQLVGEQLKMEKGDVQSIQNQIQTLNNIIAFQNAKMIQYLGTSQKQQGEDISQLLFKEQIEQKNRFMNTMLTQEQFRKNAIESLENFSKKNLVGNSIKVGSSIQLKTKMKKKSK